MTQNIGGTITIIAVALISLIFTLYLIALRKNGWLGGNSNFYRCPNQECKKIFQKPIELKDLSTNPPSTYPACPECGANLNTFFNSITSKTPKITAKPLPNQKKNEINPIESKMATKKVETSNSNQKQLSMPTRKTPTVNPLIKPTEMRRAPASNQNQKPLSAPTEKATITKPEIKPIEIKNEAKKTETPNQNQNLPPKPRVRIPMAKTPTESIKRNTAGDSGCDYFFGYLATINIKQDGTPLICLECPRTLECLLSNYK